MTLPIRETPYGPVKLHFGHLYGRPNFLHLPSRFIRISPQLGQRNFVASDPGAMGLPQLVQVTSDSVGVVGVFSSTLIRFRDRL
jgi:hypothetical protein